MVCTKSNTFILFIYYFIICIVSRYVKIFVENNGTKTPYDLEWNESIKELKQKVGETEKIPADHIDLVLHGKKLANDEIVASVLQTEEIPVLQVVSR